MMEPNPPSRRARAGATASRDASRRLLRARDAIDRGYGGPLNIEVLAGSVFLSRAHFIRSFRETFGETPHRYLQRRRLERAMALLRETDRTVTQVCLEVGFTSLGSFSRTFGEVLGISPSAYRKREQASPRAAMRAGVPGCIAMAWDRPSSTFGEDQRGQQG